MPTSGCSSALDRAGLTERLRPLTPRAEVSVKLSAIGQALGGRAGDGAKLALEHAHRICTAAAAVGAAVTLDMEDHTTTDSTLEVLHALRADFPDTACVLQAYLRRTEGDCRDLAVAGSRVRLCKGAYDEPASVAFQTADEVDRSYVRCLNMLFAGAGYPMWATHDPRLIEIALARATAYGRDGQPVRVPDAVRDPPGRAAAAGRRRADGSGVPALRSAVVRLPDAPAGRAAGQPDVLPAITGVEGLSSRGDTLAILGGGKIGEALLAGLLRSGRFADDIVVSEKHPERAAYLSRDPRGAHGAGRRQR